jgi:hypothetical protein
MDPARDALHRPKGRQRRFLTDEKTDRVRAGWKDEILEAIKAKRSYALHAPVCAAVGEFPHGDAMVTTAMLARVAGYEIEAFTTRSSKELRHADGPAWLVIPIFVLFGIAAMGAGICGTLAAMVASGMAAGVTDSPVQDWHAFLRGMLAACGVCAFFTATLGSLLFFSLAKGRRHPIFRVPGFLERCSSLEYLCLLPADSSFDPEKAADFLHRAGAAEVWEIRR